MIPEHGRWEWIGSFWPNGYARLSVGSGLKREKLVHRMSWELFRGPIPVGKCVLHQCDNRACVNPGHLFLGSKKDNTQDMIAKGRHKWSGAKITSSQADEIRSLCAAGISQREVAGRFGIAQQSVSKIIQRKRWKVV